MDSLAVTFIADVPKNVYSLWAGLQPVENVVTVNRIGRVLWPRLLVADVEKRWMDGCVGWYVLVVCFRLGVVGSLASTCRTSLGDPKLLSKAAFT